jgi:hypothetical protein
MNAKSFFIGLFRIIVPTPLQAIVSFAIAAGILVWLNYPLIFAGIGASGQSVGAADGQVAHMVQSILAWQIFNNNLVMIWLGMALMAYLVAWAGYLVLVSGRTSFADSDSLMALLREMGIKVIFGLGLVYYLAYIQPGLALWFSWVPGVFYRIDAVSIFAVIGAFLGLAAQLYGVLMMVQFTVLPWYQSEIE